MSDLDQLVQASRLYYELGETQHAIAERLGVTRPQVSRLLKRARAEGIVEIRIIDRTTAESPAADATPRHLRPRRRPPRADHRRARGPHPPDGRPARRPGPARRRSATGRSWGSATAHRSRRSPTRWRTPPRRWLGDRRAAGRRLLVAGPGARAVPSGRRRRSAGRRSGSWRRGSSTTRPRNGRSRPTPASRSILELWQRLDVALFGIGGRAGAPHRVGQRRRTELDAARCRRRGAHRPVRPRRRASSAPSCASGRSRSMPAGSVDCPVAIGVAAGEGKVGPDPRGPAGGHRPDTRDRRRDGRGRRRPRPGDARRRGTGSHASAAR